MCGWELCRSSPDDFLQQSLTVHHTLPTHSACTAGRQTVGPISSIPHRSPSESVVGIKQYQLTSLSCLCSAFLHPSCMRPARGGQGRQGHQPAVRRRGQPGSGGVREGYAQAGRDGDGVMNGGLALLCQPCVCANWCFKFATTVLDFLMGLGPALNQLDNLESSPWHSGPREGWEMWQRKQFCVKSLHDIKTWSIRESPASLFSELTACPS